MRIAIVIPSWNNPEDVRQCLRALERQTFRDFEVVVVDDGSEPSIGLQTTDYRLQTRLLRQPHSGAPAARNHGARETQSELLLFLDADIVLAPHALERLVTTLDVHPGASYAYSSFRFGWKRFSSFPFDGERLRRMPYIHTSALIRREHFPGFDETLKRFQDWDLWLTMLAHGYGGIHVRDTLFDIRHTRGTMSRWVPALLHRMPWQHIGWLPARVRAYRAAEAVIRQKHRLPPHDN